MRTPRRGSRWSADRVGRRAVYAAYLNSKAWQDKRRDWSAGASPSRFPTGVPGVRPPMVAALRAPASPDIPTARSRRSRRLDGSLRRDHARLHAVLDTSPSWRRLGRAAATVGIIGMLRRRERASRDGQEMAS
jgi:hypothetical protein